MKPTLALAIALALALSGCGGTHPAPGTTQPLEAKLHSIIHATAGDSAEIAVAFVDLESGDSVLIDAHRVMHAASTMKVPVMLELFRHGDNGKLDLGDPLIVGNSFTSIADGSRYSLSPADDSDPELYERVGEEMSVRALIGRMITRSSNLATNILIALADPDSIASTLERIGASEMKVLRGVEDIPAYERGMNNTTTAYGLMKALQTIAEGSLVSPDATEEMIGILENQEFREMIPAGIPEGVRVGNKTGSITEIHHDGAIVFPPGREPYVLVVLTRGFADHDISAAAARRISSAVYSSVAEPD